MTSHTTTTAPHTEHVHAPAPASTQLKGKRTAAFTPDVLAQLSELPSPTAPSDPDRRHSNSFMAYRSVFVAIVKDRLPAATTSMTTVTSEANRRYALLTPAEKHPWKKFAADSKDKYPEFSPNSRAKKRNRNTEKLQRMHEEQLALASDPETRIDSPARAPSSGKSPRLPAKRASQTPPRLLARVPTPAAPAALLIPHSPPSLQSTPSPESPATLWPQQFNPAFGPVPSGSASPSASSSSSQLEPTKVFSELSIATSSAVPCTSDSSALPSQTRFPSSSVRDELNGPVNLSGYALYAPQAQAEVPQWDPAVVPPMTTPGTLIEQQQFSLGLPVEFNNFFATEQVWAPPFEQAHYAPIAQVTPTTSQHPPALPLPREPNAWWATGFDENKVANWQSAPYAPTYGYDGLLDTQYQVNGLDVDFSGAAYSAFAVSF